MSDGVEEFQTDFPIPNDQKTLNDEKETELSIRAREILK